MPRFTPVGKPYEHQVDGFIDQSVTDVLEVDFRELVWARPYLLALTANLFHSATLAELPIRFMHTPSDDLSRYLSRMHFSQVLDHFEIDHALPHVGESNMRDRLLEVTSFTGDDDSAAERLSILVHQRQQQDPYLELDPRLSDEMAGTSTSSATMSPRMLGAIRRMFALRPTTTQRATRPSNWW